MIHEFNYDVAVIGAGAAGLAAAAEIAKSPHRVVLIDREEQLGGILRQCIHNGFGLRYFKEELTGPEYADRVAALTKSPNINCKTNTTVSDLKRLPDGSFELLAYSADDGVSLIRVRAIFLGMGCRERNRGNLAIPGSRPAGVFTAGAAQKLLNIEGMLPGKSAVIVGSGDIGLIMARRLCWSGVEVKAVVEIMPYPSGLTRNVVQCLDDFGIPLYLEHAMVNIAGRERVQYVDIAPLENGIAQLDRQFRIECDTVLFSVGLIPENELSIQLNVELNPATGGAVVDANLQTSVPGVFAGGNVLHVHDLVDFVSEESSEAGKSIVRYLDGKLHSDNNCVTVESNLKYVIPNCFNTGEKCTFSFRPLIVSDVALLEAELNNKVIWKRKFTYVKPAEMLKIELPAEILKTPGKLVFRLKEEA
ncbi:MAG: FAD-dependent oxidoreductase [Victivallales bacterium]|jgi:NADPH-dependent 2,4-dienoyl-CoA reductase/sulfur reductase-like enzyme|nr:FAD-dependent oxidoreductase [Victivallales bacterium]